MTGKSGRIGQVVVNSRVVNRRDYCIVFLWLLALSVGFGTWKVSYIFYKCCSQEGSHYEFYWAMLSNVNIHPQLSMWHNGAAFQADCPDLVVDRAGHLHVSCWLSFHGSYHGYRSYAAPTVPHFTHTCWCTLPSHTTHKTVFGEVHFICQASQSSQKSDLLLFSRHCRLLIPKETPYILKRPNEKSISQTTGLPEGDGHYPIQIL